MIRYLKKFFIFLILCATIANIFATEPLSNFGSTDLIEEDCEDLSNIHLALPQKKTGWLSFREKLDDLWSDGLGLASEYWKPIVGLGSILLLKYRHKLMKQQGESFYCPVAFFKKYSRQEASFAGVANLAEEGLPDGFFAFLSMMDDITAEDQSDLSVYGFARGEEGDELLPWRLIEYTDLNRIGRKLDDGHDTDMISGVGFDTLNNLEVNVKILKNNKILFWSKKAILKKEQPLTAEERKKIQNFAEKEKKYELAERNLKEIGDDHCCTIIYYAGGKTTYKVKNFIDYYGDNLENSWFVKQFAEHEKQKIAEKINKYKMQKKTFDEAFHDYQEAEKESEDLLCRADSGLEKYVKIEILHGKLKYEDLWLDVSDGSVWVVKNGKLIEFETEKRFKLSGEHSLFEMFKLCECAKKNVKPIEDQDKNDLKIWVQFRQLEENNSMFYAYPIKFRFHLNNKAFDVLSETCNNINESIFAETPTRVEKENLKGFYPVLCYKFMFSNFLQYKFVNEMPLYFLKKDVFSLFSLVQSLSNVWENESVNPYLLTKLLEESCAIEWNLMTFILLVTQSLLQRTPFDFMNSVQLPKFLIDNVRSVSLSVDVIRDIGSLLLHFEKLVSELERFKDQKPNPSDPKFWMANYKFAEYLMLLFNQFKTVELKKLLFAGGINAVCYFAKPELYKKLDSKSISFVSLLKINQSDQ